MAFVPLVFFLLTASGASASAATAAANPVRKVVTMLQSMQKKIAGEADKEEALFNKFQCYCKDGGKTLGDTISSAEAAGPALSTDIEAAEAKAVQLKADLKQHEIDRDDANSAMTKAKAMRQKDASAYAAEKEEVEATIATVKSAVAAIEKGTSASFVQTAESQNLQHIVLSRQGMLDVDRQQLLAFLSGTESSENTGEIVGILKQMGASMQKGLDEATASEEESIESYEGSIAAEAKLVGSLGASIEGKTQRVGELAVSVVQMKNDMSDTEQRLIEDKAYLEELDKACATKSSEWEERKTTRADELVALADTIKLLNDDDALELFKKTLPSASASFVQMQMTEASMRQTALSVIQAARQVMKSTNLDFLFLLLQGKKNGFQKVLSMIDAMMGTIQGEAKADSDKKEYCTAQFDATAGKMKDLNRDVSDAAASIADAEGAIGEAADAIAALAAGIKALDKSVAEATEQRKEESQEFNELMPSDAAAKELLGLAKNRLNKFYNKALYKAAPKRELSEEDRIVVNNGGTLAPTAAPGGISGTGITAFVQISEHVQDVSAPAPPPETFGAYKNKGGEATGCIAMIDLLIKDLDKEMQEAQVEETNAQADYEAMLKDSAAKRAEDAKSLSGKVAAKAELEGDVQRHTDDKAGASSELAATSEYLASMHAECDWLVQHFAVRQEARDNEVDSLKNAKAILSGADYDF